MTMQLCDRDHIEIAYTAKDCPVCRLLKDKEDLEEQVEGLREEIHDLKWKLENPDE